MTPSGPTESHRTARPTAASVDTVIGPGCRVTGTVRATGHVFVSGVVDGDVRAPSVTVAVRGHVDGSLTARDAIVAGRVDGDLCVTNHLRLTPTAAVTGGLACRRLVLEQGAHFRGHASMSLDEDPTSPRAEPLQLV